MVATAPPELMTAVTDVPARENVATPDVVDVAATTESIGVILVAGK
jgi:hypothetical protein